MKRFIRIIVFILVVSLSITACTKNEDKEHPKIILKLNISNLTEDEFKSVGAKELENPTKNDFKNIEFILDVEHSNKILNRKIAVPSIKEFIISKYKDRYWFGEGNIQDNKDENFAKYSEKIVFYSNGLDEKDIKEIFKLSEVKISWTTTNGKNEEENLNLGDNIEFR